MAGSATERIEFLDYLRGPAALFVVWDHLVGIYLERNDLGWTWLDNVRHWVNEPFGLIQDFGWFGVCLFFMISGFVITHVGLRERPKLFAINRVFRIYPPLIVSVIVIGATEILQGTAGYSWGGVAVAGTLANYLAIPQFKVNTVAWTLAIEITFYALTFVGLRWLARPVLWMCVQAAVIGVVIASARALGDRFFLFAATVAYLPYLLVGQLIYYALWRRLVSPGAFLLLMTIVFADLLWGVSSIHVQFWPVRNSYVVSFVCAIAVFVTALALNAQLKPTRVVTFLADHSYSLYLYHGFIGFLVMDALLARFDYRVCLSIAVVAVLLASVLSRRLVELPSMTFARRLGKGWPKTAPASSG